jgi:hypothetical protein
VQVHKLVLALLLARQQVLGFLLQLLTLVLGLMRRRLFQRRQLGALQVKNFEFRC